MDAPLSILQPPPILPPQLIPQSHTSLTLPPLPEPPTQPVPFQIWDPYTVFGDADQGTSADTNEGGVEDDDDGYMAANTTLRPDMFSSNSFFSGAPQAEPPPQPINLMPYHGDQTYPVRGAPLLPVGNPTSVQSDSQLPTPSSSSNISAAELGRRLSAPIHSVRCSIYLFIFRQDLFFFRFRDHL